MGITPKILINDGTLTSSSDYAIYAPAQDGVTTINGGTIMGYWGAIQLKRGTLDISGGTFENNGFPLLQNPMTSTTDYAGPRCGHFSHIRLWRDFRNNPWWYVYYPKWK